MLVGQNFVGGDDLILDVRIRHLEAYVVMYLSSIFLGGSAYLLNFQVFSSQFFKTQVA